MWWKTQKFMIFAAPDGDGGGDGGDEKAPEGQEDAPTPGSDTEPEDDADDGGDDADDGESGEAALGDPGKKALDRMKAERNAARRELRELKAKYEPESKEEAAAQTKFAQRILRSEIKAAAAGKLADPADAYRFLDLEQFEVGEDGEVDEDEIASAIADLVEKKPYLAATQGSRRKGSADGGVRKDHAPSQLTRSDLERMTPQQILEADAQGRLNKLKGV